MKLNKLLVVGGLIALYTHTHTQLLAQEPKWTIHNSIVDYQNSTTSPLPNVPNPDYTQNAIWDANGNLKVYEADGKVYNANGGLILDMNSEASSFYGLPSAQTGFTEFIFVPVPGECEMYYGITSYSDGGQLIAPNNSYISDIVWCKIDISGTGTALVLPQTGFRVAKEDINCYNRSTESYVVMDFAIHLEVTQSLSNGNRYLFAADGNCVSALEVTSSGLVYIDGYHGGGMFMPNLRSEMEVFKNDGVYEIAMSYYNTTINGGVTQGYLSIFEFDMSGNTPIMSHYNVQIMGDENTNKIVKGLEFSDDGLTLYASIMTLNSPLTSIISGDNIIYVSRSSLNQQFDFNTQYGGVLTFGSGTKDFGLGMIEKGVDGKMWFIGNNRLATLDNYNSPSITNFNDNALVISNQLSVAWGYNNAPSNGYPTYLDEVARKLYLMVDQIDGEDYTSWTSGADLYPSIIEVCSFPYTFSYMIPAGATTWYTGQTAPNGDLLTEGTMGIFYQLTNGCEYTETINIILKEDRWCDSGFEHTIGESVNPNVPVSAYCDILGSTIHEYYLYESDGQGGWLLLDTCYLANCTLTGVYNGQLFKIVHNVYNMNSQCHPFETTTHIFTIQ